MPDIEKLKEIIKELQKIMRIQDWNIGIELVSGEDFNNRVDEKFKDCQAHNEITRLLNTCYILINIDKTDNWYKSLVHELMHLAFDHLETCESLIYQLNNKQIQQSVDDVFTVALERTVERMAEIFVSVYPVTNFIK